MGDALGLPGEGLSKQRQRRLLGPISGHRFLFGRGMFSDDTEHTLLTAQALIASGGDPEKFTRYLANGLRRWIILLPPGVGKATALSCLKLLVGVSPQRSGTFSAGNGPAMRTALLGVCNGGDSRHLRALVRESARLTHTDPKAEYGALAVAVAAYLATSGELSPTLFLKRLQEVLPRNNDATELMELLAKAARSVEAGETTECFAVTNQMPNGISGYMYQTVPAALHAALSHPHDFEAAVSSIIACGGDTDTSAAIVGGIVGAGVGADEIPSAWRAGLAEWPCGIAWQERLANQLAGVVKSGSAEKVILPPAFALLARNLFFLSVVLYHGLRRVLPPY